MKLAPAMWIMAAMAGAQTIRTETQVVLVDVAVTDKKGNYVQDLTAADFRVWEDGREQKITGFSRVADSSARQHYTTLLFDTVTMTTRELAWAQETAGRFIDANLGDGHYMSVLAFGGALRVVQTFTTDGTRLKAAVNRQGMSTLSFAEEEASAANRSQAAFAARDTLRAVERLVTNLEPVPGRKSLVFFTAGFNVTSDNNTRLEAAIESANRANVAIYPVNVRALALTPEPSAPAAAAARGGRGGFGSSVQLRGDPIEAAPGAAVHSNAALQAVMFRLAEGTGGFVVRQPDDTNTLNRIGQEQNEYYLLGYTPPEGSRGACHKLRVRVERKDTEWRARQEYCNLERGDPLSGNPVERVLEQRAAADGPGDISATMRAPFFYTGPNLARVAVAMEIDASRVNFKRERGAFRAAFDILGVATRPDGGIAARFSDTVKLEFDDQKQADQFKQSPYLYQTQFDAAAGEYRFVVVFRAGGENFGRVEIPLIIEPWQPADFALSGLALSTAFRPAGAADAALDELLADGRKKFVANGVEAAPTGSAVVRAGVQTGFYAEIYEPLLGANPLLSVALQMRLFAAGAAEPKFDTGPMRVDLSQAQGRVLPVMHRIPLEVLTPAKYTLEVTAYDLAGRSARRTLDFELQ
jgi:VWFA-related protein